MIDPLSISVGVASLLLAIAKTTAVVTDFVKVCREARMDLVRVSQELATLKQILECLKKDTEESEPSPILDSLTDQIVPIISQCNNVLERINAVVEKNSGRFGPARWVIDGKKEVNGLRGELAAYSGALNVTLETISIILTRDIKADTTAIREDTTELKIGQEQILAKIEELHAQLPKNIRDNSHANFVIQRYLSSLTSYAGSAYGEARNWNEGRRTSRSRESSLQGDLVSTEYDERAMFPESSSSGKYPNPFDDSSYERASSISSRQSFEALFQDDNLLETSPITSPHRNFVSSLATQDIIDLSDPFILEEQTTLLDERKNKTNSLISIEKICSKEFQLVLGERRVSTTLEGSDQSFSPTVSNSAATLQLVDTSDSKDTGNFKRKARTSIPVPSGNWILGNTIGVGKIGKVKMVKNASTGATAACKIIPRTSGKESSLQEIRVAREVASIFLIRHPFICGFIDFARTGQNLYLIVEYVDNGTLLDYVEGHGKLKEKQARNLSRQILSALDYCHRHNIVHRDLRLENIMMTRKDNTDVIKLKGFGLSNLFSPNGHLTTSCGSHYSSAPEVLKGKPYVGPELDVWSFGVVLYSLVYGVAPFVDQSLPKLFSKIINGVVDYKDFVATDCNKLISRTLETDPLYRASLIEVMTHSWIVKGYGSPPQNYVSSHEPLTLPLDDNVIKRMTAFNFGSSEVIKDELTQIIESDEYKHAVALLKAREHMTREPQQVKSTPMKRIIGLYRKDKVGNSAELPVGEDPLNAFSPLISFYYLARESYHTQLANKSRSNLSS